MQRLVRLTAMVLLLVACSGPRADLGAGASEPVPTFPVEVPPTLPDDGFPVVVASGTGTVEIPARPGRIVSLSASATETLFAIGAGSQVVATDSFSYFPAEAPTQEDLVAFEPNVEAIVTTFQPDLVVLAFDPGTVAEAFTVLGVPVIIQDAATDFDAAYAQWEQLGAATGHLAEAVALVNRTQDLINVAVAAVGDAGQGLTFYHELDPALYSVTSATFLGAVYERFGLTNVADDADTDGWGYPQLSPEYLLDRSPALIFFTNCCRDTVESISARPGWETIAAVRDGRVFELDDDIASRWGPRIADLAAAIAASVTAAVGADA